MLSSTQGVSKSPGVDSPRLKPILCKVPEVTIYFWIIKVLCTTVGETAADFLNTNFSLGLTGISIVMGGLLIIILFFQFKAKKYVPIIYWLTVVFISVVGALITDNLTDNLGVSLITTSIIFALALTVTFGLWYRSEKTLSIHSIFTVPGRPFTGFQNQFGRENFLNPLSSLFLQYYNPEIPAEGGIACGWAGI